MNVLASALVNWGALAKILVTASVGGIGVVAAYSLVVIGGARLSERDEPGGGGTATAVPLAMVVLGGAICIAAIAAGLYAITVK